MSDLNFFDISQKFLRLVGDYINTMKTIFIDNALIPNKHFSNLQFTSKQRKAVNRQILFVYMFRCISAAIERLGDTGLPTKDETSETTVRNLSVCSVRI